MKTNHSYNIQQALCKKSLPMSGNTWIVHQHIKQHRQELMVASFHLQFLRFKRMGTSIKTQSLLFACNKFICFYFECLKLFFHLQFYLQRSLLPSPFSSLLYPSFSLSNTSSTLVFSSNFITQMPLMIPSSTSSRNI